MKKETLIKLQNNSYEIVTKMPAERNLANQRVQEVIAEEYGVSLRQVRIVNGHHNPSKLLKVTLTE